jgi:hypothetical protein
MSERWSSLNSNAFELNGSVGGGANKAAAKMTRARDLEYRQTFLEEDEGDSDSAVAAAPPPP